jgi:hypothetical protein
VAAWSDFSALISDASSRRMTAAGLGDHVEKLITA